MPVLRRVKRPIRRPLTATASTRLRRYQAAVAAKSARVLIAGDSMSVDWQVQPGVGPFLSWPWLLTAQMARSGTSHIATAVGSVTSTQWECLNISVSGWSTADHLSTGTLVADCTSWQPHLVILPSGLITWLADPTCAQLTTGLTNGINAVRAAAPNADILLVHQYEPAAATFLGWRGPSEPAVRALARTSNCEYVSVATAVGSTGTGTDPRGIYDLPASADDLVHTNQAGQSIIYGPIAAALGA